MDSLGQLEWGQSLGRIADVMTMYAQKITTITLFCLPDPKIWFFQEQLSAGVAVWRSSMRSI
jgi:hypothetical protein